MGARVPGSRARWVASAATLGGLRLAAAGMALLLALPLHAADLDGFWDVPRKGGNSFNGAPPDEAYFRALADTGASWVRLTFTKWPSARRDFLIGDASAYTGLVPEDLATLRRTLDAAHAAGLKVVVVPLGLPGARWVQQNGDRYDDRLWSQPQYADQSARFWRDLAAALKDHPAVAAYNLLNEPAPEKASGPPENGSPEVLRAWQVEVAGSTRDLQALYDRLIAAIRQVDPLTPVMVDGGWYANSRSLAAWPRRLADDRVLYAFHMYSPYEATSAPNMKRAVPLRYPGKVAGRQWDRAAVAAHMQAAYDWADAQGVPPQRLVMAEFGCMRRWADCATWLGDVLDVAEARGGSWAFYSFREDVWEGMDYELPADLPPGRYYWQVEQGQADTLPRDGALMEILRARMRD